MLVLLNYSHFVYQVFPKIVISMWNHVIVTETFFYIILNCTLAKKLFTQTNLYLGDVKFDAETENNSGFV